jgi:HNH endonuclease
MPTNRPNNEGDFWKRTWRMGECLLWTGTINSNGYGVFRYEDKTQGAHRVAWLFTHGPIPEGMSVCHRCDTPLCVNPDHLFLGTHQDNMADKIAKGRQVRGDRQWTRVPKWQHRVVRGERQAAAKLKEVHIPIIRNQYKAGIPASVLAVIFCVSKSAIWFVVNGTTWKHVK